jgi:hypothetical protein
MPSAANIKPHALIMPPEMVLTLGIMMAIYVVLSTSLKASNRSVNAVRRNSIRSIAIGKTKVMVSAQNLSLARVLNA